MTFREKLKQEHPDKFYPDGSSKGCPYEYNYEEREYCNDRDCTDCWNREIPTTSDTVTDNVNHPSHYADSCSMECIDVMEMVFGKNSLATYSIINAFKCAWRCKHKNGLEDLEKAKWYLNKYSEIYPNSVDYKYLKLREIVEKLGESYADKSEV